VGFRNEKTVAAIYFAATVCINWDKLLSSFDCIWEYSLNKYYSIENEIRKTC
jgi:hypothetical protein